MGTVIESKMDKNIGGIASFIIQNGTLRLGDPIVVGEFFGKVRTLKNDRGENLVEAKPSMPVSITGISEVPSAGDKFMAFESEKKARSIGEARKTEEHLKQNSKGTVSLEDIFAKIQEGIKEINVIVKADVNGSAEAVKNSLEKIEVEGKVVAHGKGKKIIVYKMKPKANYRRKYGHRQPYTKVEITSIKLPTTKKEADKAESAKTDA